MTNVVLHWMDQVNGWYFMEIMNEHDFKIYG